ncbi:MAG: PAS domain S-box protein [Anaerolineales bacterium]|nr:PAS domain S-box protein [Anaerolineales bacterium]
MKLSLEKKVYFGFGAALLLLVGVGLASYWSLSQLIEQSAVETRQAQITMGIIIGGTLLALVLFVVAILTIRFDIEQRKRLQESLQESEALFRSTFESAPIGIDLIDMQGGFLVTNCALQKMLGYSAEELRYMTVKEVTYESDVAETVQLFQELVQGERDTYQIKKRYQRKDGQVIWGDLTVSLVRDEQQRPLFVIGMIQDIDARKQTEEKLNKLSQAVEQSASTIVITNKQGYIEYANPRFTETTGYTIEEALGQHTRILKSGQTTAEEYKQLWQTITTGQQWRGEFLNKKKSGELYWESASISPIQNADGEITHFLAVKEDITEHKQAEAALRNSEAVQRAILDAIPDFMFWTNRQGDYIAFHSLQELAVLFNNESSNKKLTDALPHPWLNRC